MNIILLRIVGGEKLPSYIDEFGTFKLKYSLTSLASRNNNDDE